MKKRPIVMRASYSQNGSRGCFELVPTDILRQFCRLYTFAHLQYHPCTRMEIHGEFDLFTPLEILASCDLYQDNRTMLKAVYCQIMVSFNCAWNAEIVRIWIISLGTGLPQLVHII